MPRLAFKPDASFFRKIAIGTVGTRAVCSDLSLRGHELVELERGSLDTKLWKEVKRKRVRIPDLVCKRCAMRVESRAKTKAELSMSHSFTDAARAWDFGMVETDRIAFRIWNLLDLPASTHVYSTRFGLQVSADSRAILRALPEASVDLIITSPPFALLRKKSYGNEDQAEYVAWLGEFGSLAYRVIKPTGSFVLDLGGSYERGRPVRSLYNFRVLLDFRDRLGYRLAESRQVGERVGSRDTMVIRAADQPRTPASARVRNSHGQRSPSGLGKVDRGLRSAAPADAAREADQELAQTGVQPFRQRGLRRAGDGLLHVHGDLARWYSMPWVAPPGQRPRPGGRETPVCHSPLVAFRSR
jgi:hypothetical protein